MNLVNDFRKENGKVCAYLDRVTLLSGASEALSCQLEGNRLCSVSCAIQGRKKGGYCERRYVKSEKQSRLVCVCNQ
ncbi:unnamed protein product [Cylicocyclus nassatus]|uniref:Uncharacterized protein n=1 Tax=Cylicocyclus nassatus TaxID=53992 RepID=A0AA36GMX6_CYLNA|nr:unnamed protein product [Cylicocyclus nassatus]